MLTESFFKNFTIKTKRELDSLIKAFKTAKPLELDKNTKVMSKEEVAKLFERIDKNNKKGS